VALERTEQALDARARDAALVDELRSSIDEVLRPLVPGGTRCALMDFPNSGNVGDAAVWLGERSWLDRNGVEVVYACDRYTYSKARLQKELRDGVILLRGGGNLGDLWPGFQTFRESVISDFPDNRMIQLPQSVRFVDPANAERASKIFNSHPNLHLLLRDNESLDRARELFTAPSELCTDMAFAQDPPDPNTSPVHDLLWLCRTDQESTAPPAGPASETLAHDWLIDAAPHLGLPVSKRAGYAINRLFSAAVRRSPPRALGLGLLASATYDRRARQRVDRGCRILRTGRVVITDRLHGHILCCLLGIPHVVSSDRFAKLRSFYDTWTEGFSSVHFADSIDDAFAQAEELLEQSGG
jgi:exopolysaccharide biosynthesis predicted pyruvyltransferase EpsI